MKVHALIDWESNSILAWSLTEPSVHDTLELPGLLRRVGHPIREVYADAGYLSRANCIAVRGVGGTPYIAIKKTTRRAPEPNERGEHRTAFDAMVWRRQQDPEAWLRIYHRRSRIESVFGAIKRRLGGRLAALARRMIRIEASLKLLAWNLTCVKPDEF